MLLGREHISKTDPQDRATVQLRLRKISTATRVDSLHDLAVYHVDLRVVYAFGVLFVGGGEAKTNNRHCHRRSELEAVVDLDQVCEQFSQPKMIVNDLGHSR